MGRQSSFREPRDGRPKPPSVPTPSPAVPPAPAPSASPSRAGPADSPVEGPHRRVAEPDRADGLAASCRAPAIEVIGQHYLEPRVLRSIASIDLSPAGAPARLGQIPEHVRGSLA